VSRHRQKFVVQWNNCSYYSWFFSPNQQKKRNYAFITLVQVGIATRYELDIPGIEFRWARDFLHPSKRPWRQPNLLYTGFQVFPRVKLAEAWRWSTTPT